MSIQEGQEINPYIETVSRPVGPRHFLSRVRQTAGDVLRNTDRIVFTSSAVAFGASYVGFLLPHTYLTWTKEVASPEMIEFLTWNARVFLGSSLPLLASAPFMLKRTLP